MATTRRTELELELLRRKQEAIEAEMQWAVTQNNLNMPCEPGMGDSSIVKLRLSQLQYERERISVEIAEKNLELFDLQGST